MVKKPIDGTDNVYVLGVKDSGTIIPPQTQEQVDALLRESLDIQSTQIDDFLGDLTRLGDRPDIVNYGSLMKHLQTECVFHLSALASAALLRIQDLTKQLEDVDQALIECEDKIKEKDNEIRYWSNR